MQTHILLEFDGDLATLTLTPDEPGKPPTLDYAVLDELAAHIAAIRVSEGLRAVILRSASEKYFCVGANINVLKALVTVRRPLARIVPTTRSNAF